MTGAVPTAPAFRTPEAERRFRAAYQAVLEQWPITAEPVDVRSAYGTTRVQVCGPRDGDPLVLLHGGGATSAVWFANVAALGAAHRVYAVDQIGEPGGSVHDGRPIRDGGDLMDWLESTFAGLGLDRADLCGHSSGGELALGFALRSPQRVRRLALIDPTRCFTGFSPRYLLHALPVLLRPTAGRVRAFIDWETAGAPVDPGWLRLYVSGAVDFPASKTVVGRRPDAARMRASEIPTLVLPAERSRAHDSRKLAAGVRRLMPHARTVTLPGVSHHAVPACRPEELNRLLLEFLG
ncbi:carboxylesterase [Planomonospora parontospora subsp. parontospora]|uniref:Carboxylesterase n=2 Tax=Planomonospora parontospora TaxID=58119 RepID=A0AA37F7L7_9ACTN|nr:alpha/beta fold hydrolase [Planomonospora parontospora]GGK93864.1 carboxylesterase [Planomonospora parontospora]GII12412.1 carboxylesterase [Planomonospora parontospora subsp. parontospora]